MDLTPKEEKKIARQAAKFAKEMVRKDRLAFKKAMKLIFNKPAVVQLLKLILKYENRAPLFIEDCIRILKMKEKTTKNLLKEMKSAKLAMEAGELGNLQLLRYGLVAMAAKGNLESDDPNTWDWKRGFKTLEMEIKKLHDEPLL